VPLAITKPGFAKHLLDPSLDNHSSRRQFAAQDVPLLTPLRHRYDHFQTARLTMRVTSIDAPYLPLMCLERRLPARRSFASKKRIMTGVRGLVYAAWGAEARRFTAPDQCRADQGL